MATIECAQILRVGDREGQMLPAHLTSAGRAVLAAKPVEKITALYAAPDSPVTDVTALLRELMTNAPATP